MATTTPLPANGATSAQESGANTPRSPRVTDGIIPMIAVVDFHHARGPEVESWFGLPAEGAPEWPLLPFMALSDGAHASTQDFSYFTLLRPATETTPATSLFGISCTRQMDAAQLLNRPSDVTRSTVQKAVVVIADSPQSFGMLKERLSVVTQAWFAQCDFTDTEILRRFQESLAEDKARGLLDEEDDRDAYLGMSLREMIREFRWQTLVLLKCCLLQPKMLFFGSRCERLCMMQFSLISLIPGLIRKLQDCADPDLNEYEKTLTMPTNLRTSDRSSLLAYMGLPLQIFGKGSLFGPYTPLQQLDILADVGTKSYIVGSTNSLLLQQKDRYSDILINLDDGNINITSPSLRQALQLSTQDRRWIDLVTQTVNDTWDDANPGRPKDMGYIGSEEFIRLQFQDYLVALLSSVKYHNFMLKHANNPKLLQVEIEGDPAMDFNLDWVEAWMRTENYRIWNAHTDDHLFDIVESRHVSEGPLTIYDVQRRITQQVQDLHLDEKLAQGREVVGRNLQAGREKASTILNKIYADVEAFREAQRKRAEEQQQSEPQSPVSNGQNGVDPGKAQQTAHSYGEKAGAWASSWAAWAGEKRKAFARSSGSSASTPTTATAAATAANVVPSPAGGTTNGGGGGGWGLSMSRFRKENSTSSSLNSPTEKDVRSPRASMASPRPRRDSGETARPGTQESFGESILEGVSSEGTSSGPNSPNRTRGSLASSPRATAKKAPLTAAAAVPAVPAAPAPGKENGKENGVGPKVAEVPVSATGDRPE